MANQIIYIMGVSGCGKTTVGRLISHETGFPFYDGDDFHSEANVNKMKSGVALDDEDRAPWLAAINKFAQEKVVEHSALIACSALKQSYRDLLKKGLDGKCLFVHLKSDFDTIKNRIETREDHFMSSDLLLSQFETLEAPEDALVINNKNMEETLQHIIEELPKKELGFVGLGVMGKSLSRNLAGKGFALSLYNRHVDGSEEHVAKEFIQAHDVLAQAYGFDHLGRFVSSLSIPRKIFLMVPAGHATDAIIEELLPHLSAGDILIDGGNAHYKQTEKRQAYLAEKDISFIGSGVSGGESGALHGPAIMPSGDEEAYKKIEPYLTRIAARDESDRPCCAYIGKSSSGHFVKMVHNGVEYAEMQLLAEIYAILRYGSAFDPEQIADIFDQWRKTDVDSYLLEITANILRRKEGESYLLDHILDKAGNKGTGSWTTIAACELGVPIPTMTASLFARYHSAYKDDRMKTESFYKNAYQELNIDQDILLRAYRASRIINHHEGFQLILAASKHAGYDINLSAVAQIWTNGCIIRSVLMNQLTHVFSETDNMMWHEDIINMMQKNIDALQIVVGQTAASGIAIPCFSASLQHFNAYIKGQSSAHVIQAQRDYFGAHRYERVDRPGGETFHTEWE